MTAEHDILIQVEGLSKKYRSGESELVIFSGLNFEVRRGERLAIIGESGAGKSTLLYLLGALDRASEGTIHFNNKEISRYSDSELADLRNREIGFVWQNHSLLPEFTAVENVMMPLRIRGASQSNALPVSMARLEEVGLRDRASHRAGELSGGEQQRVALARALAGNPKVLLADEPTGSLDYQTGGMVMTLLENLHRTHDLTSIYVTHNLAFAERADRILKLDKGKLQMSSDVLHSESSKEQDAPQLAAADVIGNLADPAQRAGLSGARSSEVETRRTRPQEANPRFASFLHAVKEGKHYV